MKSITLLSREVADVPERVLTGRSNAKLNFMIVSKKIGEKK
jgi:hypothetical protein